MQKITIYTTPTCPYCMRAKELFRSLQVPFEEVDVASRPAERERIMNEYKWKTVPAIFIGDEMVGGYDDIAALHAKGELLQKINT